MFALQIPGALVEIRLHRIHLAKNDLEITRRPNPAELQLCA